MPQKPRGRETIGDAVRSLTVLLGLIAVIVIAYAAVRPPESLPEPIDYTPRLELAREEFSYDVLAPEQLPTGWRATSTEVVPEARGDRWRLGLLTDDEQFIGIEQSDGESESFLRDRLRGLEEDGESTVDAVTWQRWLEVGDDVPDRVLARLDADGVATVVTGTVGYAELEEFVSSLSAGA